MTTPLSLYPDAEATIAGVARALREGRTTCAGVLERCFHQVDLWDDRVHAWVYLDRSGAMHRARDLDAELAAGMDRGPLHGIPVGIKDIVDVAGMPTAAGFGPWRDRVAEYDAPIVAALREAGAVILGKTVTTQFAWIDPPPTRNPWNVERTPGGSSSGSAAAVATGMCLAAVGTQTGGSVIRPAAYCGVCGYKLEWLSVSMEGILAFAPSLDHVGVFARSVTDLVTLTEELGSRHGKAARLQRNGEAGEAAPQLIRLDGIFRDRCTPEMASAFDEVVGLFVAAGADVETGDLPFDDVHWSHRVVMASEAAWGHEQRIAEHRNDYRPRIRELIEEGMTNRAVDYARALEHRTQFSSDVDGMFTYSDGGTCPQALVLPATAGAAPGTETTGDPFFNSPWSFSGHPVVTIPLGLSPSGLPLAIQLVGPGLGHRDDLNAAALWCERVLRMAAQRGEG